MSDGTVNDGTVNGASDALRPAIATEIATFSGRVSVAYQGLGGAAAAGQGTIAIDIGAPMPSASLIKLPILACALQDAEDGRLDLGRRVPMQADDQVAGNGVLRHLSSGLEPTVHDLLTLMIIISDNTAANMAIELVGASRIQAWIRSAGMAGTELVGKLQLPREAQSERQRRGALNRTCAADVQGLFLSLERGELLPPRATARMRAILAAQIYTEGIGRALPIDPEAPDAQGRVARLETKSGCIAGVWHDAGIVRRGDGVPLFALTVLTADSGDRAERWEQEGLLTIGRIARLAFDAATDRDAPSGT
ncbi:MAG: serine hydrolase [Trueperaceae bacterium]|nr:serine hydrolase [Trueperaceae bacterium]